MLRSSQLMVSDSGEASYAVLPEGTVADTEWQKSSGLTKRCSNVPEAQGIPVPHMPCIRVDSLFFTVLSIGLLTVPFMQVHSLRRHRFIPASDIQVEVETCHVIMEDTGRGLSEQTAGLRLQWWPFMGTVEVSGDGSIRAKAIMQDLASSWFRCEARVFAPVLLHRPDASLLQGLRIKTRPGEVFTNVHLQSGRLQGPLYVEAGSLAVINVGSVRCDSVITIRSKDTGIVNLKLGTQGSSARKWVVQSLNSPVFVEASSAVRVEMGSSVTYSSLEAEALKEDGNGGVLCAEDREPARNAGNGNTSTDQNLTSRRLRLKSPEPEASVHKRVLSCHADESLSFSSEADAGLHVRSPCKKCQECRWKHQVALTSSDSESMTKVREFIKDASRKPWIATIRVAGTDKTWTLASAPAYIYVAPAWFTVFAFGGLAPRALWEMLQLEGDIADPITRLGSQQFRYLGTAGKPCG